MPITIAGLPAIASLSTREANVCAVSTVGEVWCWGNNSAGQLGTGAGGLAMSSTPVRIPEIADARAVSTGAGSVCALLSTGRIVCWGANESGQLGGGYRSTSSASPVEVLSVTDAVEVALGFDHACAILSSGSILCWGDNASGELGISNGWDPPFDDVAFAD